MKDSISLEISPKNSLVDSTLQIFAKNLLPRSTITITAATSDYTGRIWQSSANYLVDSNGTIDLSKQAPLTGSYHKIDPMGLIWSMRPVKNNQLETTFVPNKKNQIIFTLIKNNKEKIETLIERDFFEEGIKQIDVVENNVVGKLFIPPGDGPFPTILFCGGTSEGMASQSLQAALLAARGFVVFVMSYFNYAHLSKELYEVPIEIFYEAVKWLTLNDKVKSDQIAAIGIFKGAEGLLASAAMLPEINLKAIIAISPSNVIWQGLGKGRPKLKSSWSFQGKPLPYLKIKSKRIIPQFILSSIVTKLGLKKYFPKLTRTSLLPVYEAVKGNSYEIDQATIPVEKIQAPLLLIAGNKDKLWPSVYMSQAIINHRKSNFYNHQDEFVTFDGAGHITRFFPYLPSTIPWMVTRGGKMIINFGGNAYDNANAQENTWKKILAFLEKHLKGK